MGLNAILFSSVQEYRQQIYDQIHGPAGQSYTEPKNLSSSECLVSSIAFLVIGVRTACVESVIVAGSVFVLPQTALYGFIRVILPRNSIGFDIIDELYQIASGPFDMAERVIRAAMAIFDAISLIYYMVDDPLQMSRGDVEPPTPHPIVTVPLPSVAANIETQQEKPDFPVAAAPKGLDAVTERSYIVALMKTYLPLIGLEASSLLSTAGPLAFPGIILRGKPGNGKTYIAEKFLEEVKKEMPNAVVANMENATEKTGEGIQSFLADIATEAKKTKSRSFMLVEMDQYENLLPQLIAMADQKGIFIVGVSKLERSFTTSRGSYRTACANFCSKSDYAQLLKVFLEGHSHTLGSADIDTYAESMWKAKFTVRDIKDNVEKAAMKAAATEAPFISIDHFPQAAVEAEEKKQDIAPEKEEPSGNGFDDIIGMAELKAQLDILLNTMVIQHGKCQEHIARAAEAYGITMPSGLLLYGAPGNGKSYVADKVPEELGRRLKKASYVTSLDMGKIGVSYVHETTKKISEVFDKAADEARLRGTTSFVIIHEVDTIIQRDPKAGGDRSWVNEEGGMFLLMLEKAAERGIYVIGTTNYFTNLDPAVLRPGRFSTWIEIPNPDEHTSELLIQHYLGKSPQELSAEQFIELGGKIKTNQLSISSVKEAVESVKRQAFYKYCELCREAEGGVADGQPTEGIFQSIALVPITYDALYQAIDVEIGKNRKESMSDIC